MAIAAFITEKLILYVSRGTKTCSGKIQGLDSIFSGYSHDSGNYEFHSGMSSFHLHIFLCICLHDAETKLCPRTSHSGMSSFWFSI